MKKVILKLEWSEDNIRKKAMKSVSGFTGVESISMDTKDNKLTVTGDIDTVKVVGRLRKFCHTEIVSVGPAKEPEKAEPKKDDKTPTLKDCQSCYQQYWHYQYSQPINAYAYPYGNTYVEEDRNACVIC